MDFAPRHGRANSVEQLTRLEQEALADLEQHLPGLPHEPALHRRSAQVVAACRWVLAANAPGRERTAADAEARWAFKTSASFLARCHRDALGLPPTRDREQVRRVLSGCLTDASAWRSAVTIAGIFFDCVGVSAMDSKRQFAWD